MKILANLRFTLLSSYLKPSFPSYSSFGLFHTISYGSTYFLVSISHWWALLWDRQKKRARLLGTCSQKAVASAGRLTALGLTALGKTELSRRKCFANEAEITDCTRRAAQITWKTLRVHSRGSWYAWCWSNFTLISREPHARFPAPNDLRYPLVSLTGSPTACRRIRTRVFYSAMDKNAGENEKIAFYYVDYRSNLTYNPLCSLHAVTANLYTNCTGSAPTVWCKERWSITLF